MKFGRITFHALTASIFAIALPNAAAFSAETKLIDVPTLKYNLSLGGVDLNTGRYVYSEVDLAIGPEESGLKLVRMLPHSAAKQVFGNFSHNWDFYIRVVGWNIDKGEPGLPDLRAYVYIGGRAYTFEACNNCIGYTYKSGGPLARLTTNTGNPKTATAYNFRDPSGREIAFSGTSRTVTDPDGTQYQIQAIGAQSASIRSSRGYAFLLMYQNGVVTKACALNLTIAPIPATGLCPTGNVQTTYAYDAANLRMTAATDTGGATSTFVNGIIAFGETIGFVKAGHSQPWLTNTMTSESDEKGDINRIVERQQFADGRLYIYNYQRSPITTNRPSPGIVGVNALSDPSGVLISYTKSFPIQPGSRTCLMFPCSFDMPDDYLKYSYQATPGPTSIIDELNRETTADYCDPVVMAGLPAIEQDRCAVVPMVSMTDPEGNVTKFKYDGEENVTELRKVAKAGSGLADAVTTAAYDVNNPKALTKPIWVKDALGNQTDVTYSPLHGGIMTQTGPAVNGVRPQSRFTYEQRYARVSNGSGGFVQVSTPVWLLTQESFCRTSSATGTPAPPCSVANDEVRTTYDYGSLTGASNLSLKGKVVTADGVSLRTCFGYDVMGNRISSTTPRAGLSVCL